MLPEDEKTRIRKEEIFRHEVQQELRQNEAKRPAWRRVLSALNQPITLWVLSALVATWWTNHLTELADQREAHREQMARAERIRQELVLTRLDTVLAIAEPLRCIDEQLGSIHRLLGLEESESTQIQTVQRLWRWDQSQGAHPDAARIPRAANAGAKATKDLLKLDELWSGGSPMSHAYPEFAGFSDAALLLQYERLTNQSIFHDIDFLTSVASMNSVEETVQRVRGLAGDHDLDADDFFYRLKDALQQADQTRAAFLAYVDAIVSFAGKSSQATLSGVLHRPRTTTCAMIGSPGPLELIDR